MVPDPALRGHLKEYLTYSDNRDLALAWQEYTEKKHPSSRELSSVMAGHSTDIKAKSAQLSFLFSHFCSLFRNLGVGSRKMQWLSSKHPYGPQLSQVFQVWARSWGHIRATCESGGLTK